MRKSKYSEYQIINAIKQSESGVYNKPRLASISLLGMEVEWKMLYDGLVGGNIAVAQMVLKSELTHILYSRMVKDVKDIQSRIPDERRRIRADWCSKNGAGIPVARASVMHSDFLLGTVPGDGGY